MRNPNGLLPALMAQAPQQPQMAMQMVQPLNDAQAVAFLAVFIDAPTAADRVASAIDLLAEAFLQTQPPDGMAAVLQQLKGMPSGQLPPILRMVQQKMALRAQPSD